MEFLYFVSTEKVTIVAIATSAALVRVLVIVGGAALIIFFKSTSRFVRKLNFYTTKSERGPSMIQLGARVNTHVLGNYKYKNK